MTADAIARLKITLDDVIPPVLRRIEVPLTIRLDRLHLVLQAAIGWTNSHLYELRAGDVGWGIPDQEFLAARTDPKHERHAEYAEWMDLASFDPKFVDLDAHVRAVAALAKQWPRKPAVKRK